MVNHDRIRDKLQSIKDNLSELDQIAKYNIQTFVADTILFHATTRMLQISIEAILDIAQHIVARNHLGTPKTYREAIELLAGVGIVSEEQLPTLLRMIRFRNRVVHQYDDVSREEVYKIATLNLSDFEVFISAIVRYSLEVKEEQDTLS